MNFAQPQLLWVLALAPLAGALAYLLWHRRLSAWTVWARRELWPALSLHYAPWRLFVSLGSVGLAVFGVALALAQPRWGQVEEEVQRSGVDIVFVLDSSLSMAADDLRPTRMAVAQHTVRRLVRELPGHRVGLVQAEGAEFVLAPLTTDVGVVDLLLDSVMPATLPKAGTRLAGAFRKALEMYPEGSEKHRVVVLLSDGEDHDSGLLNELGSLNEAGVVVHAVGIGTRAGSPIPIGDGPRYKEDADGNVVVTKLNEELLERLTRATGGLYVRSTGLGTDVGPILESIDSMQKRTLEGQTISTMAERFQWPLALAALALLLYLTLSPLVPRKAAA